MWAPSILSTPSHTLKAQGDNTHTLTHTIISIALLFSVCNMNHFMMILIIDLPLTHTITHTANIPAVDWIGQDWPLREHPNRLGWSWQTWASGARSTAGSSLRCCCAWCWRRWKLCSWTSPAWWWSRSLPTSRRSSSSWSLRYDRGQLLRRSCAVQAPGGHLQRLGVLHQCWCWERQRGE